MLLKSFGLSITISLLLVISQETSAQRNYAEHVTIVRDSFGVPHIYGEKNVDVAYALAWANAEDDFKTIEDAVLMAKGKQALAKGKEGAIMDFVTHFFNSRQEVKTNISKLSTEYRDYLEAWVSGLNAYAASHKNEVRVKNVFPVTLEDVLVANHATVALISFAQEGLEKGLSGKLDDDTLQIKGGSNAFVFNKNKTSNGNTIAVINPHVPFEGFFSWYEAHLVSEEGMNVMGATLTGGPSIFLGATPHYAWAHTWNGLDLTDVYRLRMTGPKTYAYGDKEYFLEERTVKLRVKIKKWLPPIPVKKKTYMSHLGPVVKSKKENAYYATRYANQHNIQATEQWYYMSIAKDLKTFKEALDMQFLPRFTTIYADKDGNIFMLENGRIPVRKSGFDYTKVLPGDNPDVVWDSIYPVQYLPQYTNPACGFLFNTNNTPFDATCTHLDIMSEKYSPDMGFRMGNNNRSLRFMELMDEYPIIDFNTAKKIKYDTRLPKQGVFYNSLKPLLEANPDKYPEYKDLLTLMHSWDQIASDTSTAATPYLLVLDYVFKKKNYDDNNFMSGFNLDTTSMLEGLKYAKKFLLKHYNSIRVPLGEVQVLRRGKKEVSLPGFPDALAANYSKHQGDGKYVGWIGDSFTMIVEYDKNGPVRIESLVAYGSSSKPDSKHYTDQMELFSKQQTKPMTFDRKTIEKNAERIYKPIPPAP